MEERQDLISRRVAIEAIDDIESEVADGFGFQYEKWREYFCELPAAQPDHTADIGKKVSISCGQENDLISRQAARHALCKAVHKGEDIPCENQTASCLWTGTRVCDYVREIDALPSVQPDHIAYVSKKEDMMHEYIYKIVKDCDGVYCYIKRGEMIRCKDCEHWKNEHLCESMSRFGSFETKADFYCGYAERKINERTGG